MPDFKLVSSFGPKGDQPKAIDSLVSGLLDGKKHQTLLGVTGSGKTFTIANAISRWKRPVLVITHNKTLAAQLYNEFKEFFPDNAVEYFVSYYDYYQPESYLPQTDTYIAKDASINEDIDRLRLSATRSLLTRDDVIIVASVSCIYGIGMPEEYRKMSLEVKRGMRIGRDEIISRLVDMQYERNDVDLKRAKFRVRGDVIDIHLSYESTVIRIELFGDAVESVKELHPVTLKSYSEIESTLIFPAKHFVMPEENTRRAVESIRAELKNRLKELVKQNKLVEAQRLEQRTEHDLEMLGEIGYCSGIENYSRHFDGRSSGSPPSSLLDFFPKDFLIVVDESHATIPQLRGMYAGDFSRKQSLVNYGFRLPSAFDNRPLRFEEFKRHIHNIIYVSATPQDYELDKSGSTVEQITRPTGLLDPEIEVRPAKGQVEDLIKMVGMQKGKGFRTLVTTLTKKQAEQLSEFMVLKGIKVRYMHSDIKTLERTEIIRDLRLGKFDCLVGVNLLREGLDIPEVSLVAIFDADKEGFLRNARSLIQTIGRASRNSEGKAILYADKITGSMKTAMEETLRRREIQESYNKEHDIVPKTIVKGIQERVLPKDELANIKVIKKIDRQNMSDGERETLLAELELLMNEAAEMLEFEKAAVLRDKIRELKG
ncbi:MAG: excinuclease ABC subunit UvrB [Candidatus Aenigmarchaeota archaeon]|nr:excinuclease ABC subunit UvrB [Candidatus Aenigmarchaeota archaeon]